MKMFKEVILTGKTHGRRFSADIRWTSDEKPKPVILFIHGFKGFKDWGIFPQVADELQEAGFVVVKMNLSHNGLTPDNPVDFVDLDAFSENTFSFELADIRDTVDFIHSNEFPVPEAETDLSKLYMIGHSRGGAVSLLYGAEDDRIRAIAGWAAVVDLEGRWPEDVLAAWQKQGVIYIPNARTGQDMPMKYSIVEDYMANRERYSIPDRLKGLNKPVLLVHGTHDETVPFEETRKVVEPLGHIDLKVVDGANHVFGATHPFTGSSLPEHARELLHQTISFLNALN